MKIRPVEAELLHADRRTDMTKLIVAFSQFCERAQQKKTLYNKTTKIVLRKQAILYNLVQQAHTYK